MTGKWTPGPLAIWGVQDKTEIGGFYMIGCARESGGCTAYVNGHFNATLYAASPALYEALLATRALVSEGAADGFTDHAWMERLFHNQAAVTKALSQALGEGQP